MSGLQKRIRRLEQRRPELEWKMAEERARFEVDSIFASAPLSATGGPLPLSQLRELFGPDFLVAPQLRRRRR